MQSEKGFLQFFVGLIVVLLVALGFFGWVYFKPHYSFQSIKPSPIPHPSIEQPKITIDQLFSNFASKPVGQIPVSISGKMIYRRVEELFISDLDGSHEMKIANVPADLGGYAGRSEDGTKVYTSIYENNQQNVYQTDLKTNEKTKIFSMPLKVEEYMKSEGFLWGAIRVSPDGKYFATTGNDGIYLFTVATGQIKNILPNNTKPNKTCNEYGFGCYSFSTPVWSSDSRRLAVEKSIYESGQTTIINPFTGQIVADNLAGGVDNWSKTGRILTITEQPYKGSDLYIIDEGHGQTKADTLSSQYLDLAKVHVDDGDWSADNTFAFTPDNFDYGVGYYLYNPTKHTLQTVPVAWPSAIPEKYSLKMLPSGQGVLLLGEKSGLWILANDQKTKTQMPTKMDELIDVF